MDEPTTRCKLISFSGLKAFRCSYPGRSLVDKTTATVKFVLNLVLKSTDRYKLKNNQRPVVMLFVASIPTIPTMTMLVPMSGFIEEVATWNVIVSNECLCMVMPGRYLKPLHTHFPGHDSNENTHRILINL